MRSMIVLQAAALLLPAIAAAQGAHSEGGSLPDRPRSAAAAARYPQPVRAGDLMGRAVIEDTQQQAVLGRVVAATRGADGKFGLLLEHGGFLGFGTRRVVVPIEAMALLGYLVVLKDIAPSKLEGLPSAPTRLDVLPGDAVLHMGLARN